MIHLEQRQIDDQGVVSCDIAVLRESLYRTGSWPNNVQCNDAGETQLYNKAIKFLDLDWPELGVNTSTNPEWFTPQAWANFDIELWCLHQCQTEDQFNRCKHELELFANRGLIPVLKHLKYLVDHWRKHKFVWGVGRGSSISSYVLYLIGVHKIDPLLYELDCTEFFKNKET